MSKTQGRDVHMRDEGGGLYINGAFVIHTSGATIPAGSIVAAATQAGLHDRLLELAKRISGPLLFHPLAGSEVQHRLVPAPCPNASGNVPWFFLNAATSSKHCIAGEDDAIHALVSILQRPWCVLEFCCVEYIDILQAALKFVQVCMTVPRLGDAYQAAFQLLLFELQLRNEAIRLDFVEPLGSPARKQEVLEKLKEVSAAIFVSSMDSWAGLWLRALCSLSVLLRRRPVEIAYELARISPATPQTSHQSRSEFKADQSVTRPAMLSRRLSMPTTLSSATSRVVTDATATNLSIGARSNGPSLTVRNILRIYIQMATELLL